MSSFYQIAPIGWIECETHGSPVPSTRIIPMKAPIAGEIHERSCNDGAPRFGTRQVREGYILPKDSSPAARVSKVISLTFAQKYYAIEKLSARGVEHKQIHVQGGTHPDAEAIHEFVSTVVEFDKSAGKEDFVAVHCTHGHNRTGYMILQYLMRRPKYNPDAGYPEFTLCQARDLFTDARQGGILAHDLLLSLYEEYAVPEAERKYPVLPGWKQKYTPASKIHSTPVQEKNESLLVSESSTPSSSQEKSSKSPCQIG